VLWGVGFIASLVSVFLRATKWPGIVDMAVILLSLTRPRPRPRPHTDEACFILDAPDGDSPGDAELQTLAAERCDAAFERRDGSA